MERPIYLFGPFRLDAARRTLRRDGKPVEVPPVVFDILLRLVESRGLVRHTDLVGPVVSSKAGLATAMKRLRHALGDDWAERIENLPRVGFRLNADVTVEIERATSSGELPAEAVAPRPPPGRLSWARVATVGGVLGGVALIAASVWLARPARGGGGRPAVAVLGLKQLGGPSDTAWLGTALAELLASEVAATGAVRPVPGEAVARARRDLDLPVGETLAADTLARIRRHTGCDLLIVGSYVVVADGQIRVDLRLQDAKSGEITTLAGESGTTANLLLLAAALGESARGRLGVTPLETPEPGVTRAALPRDPAAARAYAEGLDLVRGYDVLAAARLFERAIALDPGFAQAHAELADALRQLGRSPEAVAAAHRAVELSSSLPRAERLLMQVRAHQAAAEWSDAVKTLESLCRFYPDEPGHRLALAEAQGLAGLPGDARASCARLRTMSGLLAEDPRVDLIEARSAYDQGDLVAAESLAAKAGARARAAGMRELLARTLRVHAAASRDLEGGAKLAAESIDLYRALGNRAGIASGLVTLGSIRYDQGRNDEAMASYEPALALARELGNMHLERVILVNAANVATECGRIAEAIVLYREALTSYREVGDGVRAAIVACNLSGTLAVTGALREARELAEEADRESRRLALPGQQLLAEARLASVLLSLGDVGNACRVATGAAALRGRNDEPMADALYAEAAMECSLAAGDVNGAAAALDPAALRPGGGAGGEHALRAYAGATLNLARGRIADATHQAADASALSAQLLGVRSVPKALCLQARVALASADMAGAAAAARRASAEAERMGLRDERARALLLFAEAHLATDVNAARAELHLATSMIQTSEDRLLIVEHAIVSGRMATASGEHTHAEEVLRRAVTEAGLFGHVPLRLEAELALGELELASGANAKGSERIAAVERDATARGLGHIARRAASATQLKQRHDGA